MTLPGLSLIQRGPEVRSNPPRLLASLLVFSLPLVIYVLTLARDSFGGASP